MPSFHQRWKRCAAVQVFWGCLQEQKTCQRSGQGHKKRNSLGQQGLICQNRISSSTKHLPLETNRTALHLVHIFPSCAIVRVNTCNMWCWHLVILGVYHPFMLQAGVTGSGRLHESN